MFCINKSGVLKMMLFELPVNAKKNYMHVFDDSECITLFEKYDSFLTRYLLCSIEGTVRGGLCYYPILKIGKKILAGSDLLDMPPTELIKNPKIEWVRSKQILEEYMGVDIVEEMERRLLRFSLKFALDNKIAYFLPNKYAPKRERVYITKEMIF